MKEGKHVVLSDFVKEKGEAYYEVALEKGLEGVVAKKKDSVYEPGVRSGNWLKIKKIRSCDCVILALCCWGFTATKSWFTWAKLEQVFHRQC